MKAIEVDWIERGIGENAEDQSQILKRKRGEEEKRKRELKGG